MSREDQDAHVTPAAIRSLKADLRKQILAKRDALSAEQRKALSDGITRRLLALDAYRKADCVMAYMSLGSEFETGKLVADALARHKTLVLPRVDRGNRGLRLHRVQDPDRQLAAGVWGIREPRVELCPEVTAEQIEFVLVPGVAFTRHCERLGYGAGYYDRLIGGFERRPALVAAAFGIQLVDALPISASDQKVDLVITENAAYSRVL